MCVTHLHLNQTAPNPGLACRKKSGIPLAGLDNLLACHIDREQMCRIALEGIKIPLSELSADRCDGLEASVGHGHIMLKG